MLTISLILNILLICVINIINKQKEKLQDDKRLMLHYVSKRLRKKRGMTITEIHSITRSAYKYPNEFRTELKNLEREIKQQEKKVRK